MNTHYILSIILSVVTLIGCQQVPRPEDFPLLTTPALERIPDMREQGASKVEWEDNLSDRIEIISSADRLRAIISEWNLTKDELSHWVQEYSNASEVIYYGTDLDGRMVIFYDRLGRSIASWASWDRFERDQEVEQAAPSNR